jgi:D-3-phosphoglycerate dehydrogenase / 2-oxoglutarate reductase
MRILVAEPLAEEGLALLRTQHQVDVRTGLPRAEFLAALPDYDALMVRSQVRVDAEAIAAGSRLAVIGRAGVGVDNVDLDAATRAGIVVVNAPTGNTVAAAEHTLALMFALARRVAAADASVRRGEWRRSAFTGVELRGRTLGIVGLGKIGMAIADRARGLQMEVVGHDPFVSAEAAANHGVTLCPFDELLAIADVVTLHVPVTRTTKGLIGAAQLARMKPTAFLLNVSRGSVVDEDALAAALREGRIAGAGLDVYVTEPPTASPILEAPNTVLTPHLGASTAEAQVRVAVEAAEQVLDVLDGRPALYAVNAPLVAPETAQALAPFLPLAETLGQLYAQLAPGPSNELTLEIAGELAGHETGPLGAAVLRGLLEAGTTERVNQINAPAIARARGIALIERKLAEAGPFASLVTLSGTTTVGGTVAGGEQRIVRLGDHLVDMAPAPHMLVTSHRDRPGTMGRVGVILGEHDVNISAMHLARRGPREEAKMILALDEPVPDEAAAAIRADPDVLDLWLIRLSLGD